MSTELQEFLKYSEQEAVNKLLNEVTNKLRSGHYTAEGLSGETLNTVVDAIKTFTEQQVNLKKKLTRIGSALSAERNQDALLEMIVVEAMKMQNELKSPKAGTLKEFRVSEGDTVSAGDVLALVE